MVLVFMAASERHPPGVPRDWAMADRVSPDLTTYEPVEAGTGTEGLEVRVLDELLPPELRVLLELEPVELLREESVVEELDERLLELDELELLPELDEPVVSAELEPEVRLRPQTGHAPTP